MGGVIYVRDLATPIRKSVCLLAVPKGTPNELGFGDVTQSWREVWKVPYQWMYPVESFQEHCPGRTCRRPTCGLDHRRRSLRMGKLWRGSRRGALKHVASGRGRYHRDGRGRGGRSLET